MVGRLMWYAPDRSLSYPRCQWAVLLCGICTRAPEPLSPQLHDNHTTTTEKRRGWTRELWTLLTLSEAAGVWCWIMKTDYPPTAACQRVMHCDQTRCSHPCPGVTCHVPCHTCQHSHFSDQTWSGAGNNLNKLSFRFWREKREKGIRMQSLDVAFYWSTAFSNTIPIV